MVVASLILYGAAVVAWNLARLSPLATWPPFELADLFGFVMYLPWPPAVGIAAVLRSRRALAALALAAVPFAVEYGPVFTPSRAPSPGSGLRIVTANVHFGNQRADDIASTLVATDADVVAVHELGATMAGALSERLDPTHPHTALHPRGNAFGMGVFSRLPIRSSTPPRLGRQECSCMRVVVDAGGHDVTIVVAHPLRPAVSRRGLNTRIQEHSMDDLLAEMRALQDRPALLVGDLNIADRHAYYRRLRSVMQDSHRDAGSGFGFTWQLPTPLVRIDYVLHDGSFSTVRAYAGDMPGSDHRFVFAELRLVPAAG